MSKVKVELNIGAIKNQVLKSKNLDSILTDTFRKVNKTDAEVKIINASTRRYAKGSKTNKPSIETAKKLMSSGNAKQRKYARYLFSQLKK